MLIYNVQVTQQQQKKIPQMETQALQPHPQQSNSLQPSHRRLSTTTQLFHRLDSNSSSNKFITSRQLRTSKDPRSIRHQVKKISLDNTKQNISQEKFFQSVNARGGIKVKEQQIAAGYLLELRKQYDKMAKTIKQQTASITHLKKQTNHLKTKTQTYISTSLITQKTLQTLSNSLSSLQQKQTNSTMQTKTLEQIISRMKAEQLTNKNIWSNIESVLKQKKTKLKNIEEEILQWDQTIHRSVEHLSKIQDGFMKSRGDRQRKLGEFRGYLGELGQQEKFQLQRKQRTFDLLSMQSNDIMDAKNIVLRDVLMTNKLLSILLQQKIQTLLNQNQALQSNYHLIKCQTNISDPQLLAKKFFSYSDNLQELTSKIALFEERQEALLLRNRELKELQRENIARKLEEEKLWCCEGIDVGQGEMEKLVQECYQKEFILKKIKTWLEKINVSLHLSKKHKHTPSSSSSSSSPSQNQPLNSSSQASAQILQICQHLSLQLQQLKNQNSQASPSSSALATSYKFQSPGIRLKKVIKQFSDQQIKQRRSQAQEVRESNNYQNVYIHQQRRKVKNMFLIKMHSNGGAGVNGNAVGKTGTKQ